MQDDLAKALKGAGFNAESLDRIRLARGVVGKASYVAGAAIITLGVVAFSLRDPFYLFCIAGLAVFVFVAYFIGTLWFAHKHPGVALLEGAELIQWRQMEMTASNVPEATRIAGSQRVLISPADGK